MRWACALVCLVAACGESPKPASRWMIAKQAVTASDDSTVQLRRGFGVQVVEVRGGRARTSEGHWLPLADLEAAAPLSSAPAALPMSVPPPDTTRAERWLDVDTAAQRLVAYEGDRPVRAMKISSGVGEDGALYATPRGTFRIYAKLRSATMASEVPAVGAPPDPHPYRFEAVPSVQYFNREIALHGAYWHRRFGERISHGCVNLAPGDADWLFEFTAPSLTPSERERSVAPPERGKLGTLVRVR